jgi:hypothetical protein
MGRNGNILHVLWIASGYVGGVLQSSATPLQAPSEGEWVLGPDPNSPDTYMYSDSLT